MEGFVFFCCALLFMVGISDAVMCISNVNCPNNGTICLLNCSVIAVQQFGLPASHGNCRLLVTNTDDIIHSCYIDECTTSFPELCVALSVEGEHATACCCTDDYCNTQFHDPPDVTDDDRNKTVDGVKNTTAHIYKTFPNHTTEGT